MNFSGFWYNPARAGEGINIEEHSDGKVFAVFFTLYGSGDSEYFPCDGKRVGNGAALTAYRVDGVPGNHTEEALGVVTLVEIDGTLSLRVDFAGRDVIAYDLQRWYTSLPIPVPLATVLVQKRLTGTNTWIDSTKIAGKPHIFGSTEVYYSKISAAETPPFVLAEYTVKVLTGKITITDIAYGDPYGHKPKVQGVVKGQVFEAGETMNLKFLITDRIVSAPAGFKQVTWDIFSKEWGEPSSRGPQFCNLSANIVYGF